AYNNWESALDDERGVLDLATHHATEELPATQRRLIRNLHWLQSALARVDARLQILSGSHLESRDASTLRQIGRIMDRVAEDYSATVGDDETARLLDASAEMSRLAGRLDLFVERGTIPGDSWGRTLNDEIANVRWASRVAVEAALHSTHDPE
ncbi:MAG: hypothetical protein AAFQ82_10075, partial [Myxococcota bacterium]